MSSSLVGITKTVVGEFLALMICALARFACGVEMDAHPFHVLERRLAHFPRMFADAGGEHDRLGAVDRRRKPAELASDAGDEIGDGVARRGLSDASSSRMSCDKPDMPLSPEFFHKRSDIASALIFFSAMR